MKNMYIIGRSSHFTVEIIQEVLPKKSTVFKTLHLKEMYMVVGASILRCLFQETA